MRSTTVNFGRWLERLGLKFGNQPDFAQTVQPVAVVADHRSLVSEVLGPSYIVGAAASAVLPNFAAVQLFGTAGAWVEFTLGSPAAGDWAVEIGFDASTLPPLVAPVALVPQLFAPGPELRIERGELVVAPSIDTPAIRVNTNVFCRLPRLFKPPGGWIQIASRTAASTGNVTATVYELPAPNAQ